MGQHHLQHDEVCAAAVEFLDCASLELGRRVVEIGAGSGVLTRNLLAAGARVVAVEIDPPWIARLFESFRGEDKEKLLIVHADATSWPFCLREGDAVAGNLPYNVATRLIETLLDQAPVGVRAAFLVQHEVAQRLTASCGDAQYGSFSILTKARAEARILRRVAPGSFRPPPRVASAFVGLAIQRRPVASWQDFKRFVRAGFAQRRKKLVHGLLGYAPRDEVVRRMAICGLDPDSRAENLSAEDFLQLFAAFATPGNDSRVDLPVGRAWAK